MSARAHRSVDVVRRVAIVALLLVGVVLLHRFAPPVAVGGFDPRGLMSLGFVVLAAFAVGELAEVLRIPAITGYLFTGLLLGPSAAHELAKLLPRGALPPPFDEGLLGASILAQLSVLDDLALPLICLTAGGEIDLRSLRGRFGVLGAVLAGQVVAAVAVMMAFVWAISGGVEAFTLPALVGLPAAAVLPVGGMLGALALATSAAAVIAVLLGTGAQGVLSRTILGVVVLKDVVVVVLYAAFGAWASSVLGSGDGGGFAMAMVHLVVSVFIGLAFAGAVHAYLRFVAVEPLLALTGLIFTAVWTTQQLHGEVAVVFLVAGTLLANGSSVAEVVLQQVERMALPVFVVFFTMAGAKLHLDVLGEVAGFAVALVLLRAGALAVGSWAGAVASGADDLTRRYVWTGMVAQAGLTLSLAAELPHVLPVALGEGLLALVIAGVAVHEMAGPALLQTALGLAGETAAARAAAAERVSEGAQAASRAEAEGGDTWGGPCPSPAPEVVAAVDDLQRDVQGAVEGWLAGAPRTTRTRNQAWVAGLRRELLRAHRRSAALARTGSVTAEALDDIYRELAESWRSHVLRRSARPESGLWEVAPLVAEVDRAVDRVPESLQAPLTEEVLAARDEGWLRATRRAALRARHRVRPIRHAVALQDLARYHVGGLAVRHLEGLAALGLRMELDLADYVGHAFSTVTRGWSKVTHLVAGGAAADAIEAAVWEVRAAVEAELQLAQDAVARGPEDADRRARAVLGRALRDVKADCLRSGTLNLPYRHRRFGRVYGERNLGLRAMTQGLADAKATLAARYAGLALDMEVAALEVEVSDAVERHGAALARMADELGARQLGRARDAVGEALETMRQVLDGDAVAEERAARLRAAAEPALKQVAESERLVGRVQEQLSEEAAIAPLRDALLSAGRGLTDWYAVPTAPIQAGDWSLPPATPTADVHLRETALAFIETRVASELLAIVREEARTFHAAHDALMELERMLPFNLDIATAELEIHRGGQPPEAAVAIASELVGNVARGHAALVRATEAVGHRGHVIREAVRTLVRTRIARLRELSAPPRDGSELHRVLQRGGGGLRGGLRQRVERGVASAVGRASEGIVDLWQGVRGQRVRPSELAPQQADAETFAPLRPRAELPMVYRRLFSDQGLGADDVHIGRRLEISRAASALGRLARLRTVALVGAPGTGKGTLASAIWRELGGAPPHVIRLERPATTADVDRWFDAGHDRVQLDGLRWLFRLEPGGADALVYFVERLVQDEGHSAWVLSVDGPVWRAACELAPLREAMAEVIDVAPLTAAELEAAVLARHRMSAYQLAFDPPAGTWARLRDRLQADRRQQRWFQELHVRTGGVMVDAMRLWLGSLHDVDAGAGTMQVGPLPRGRLGAVRRLPDADLLVLRHALRQGSITAELMAAGWRVDEGTARATLAGLQARGLLEPDGDTLRVARHLRTVLLTVLGERGWLP